MQLSDKGAAFLRAHEGFVGRWYADPVGIGTIGVGFTWGSESFREWWGLNRIDKFGPGARMTRGEADDALRFLVDREYGKAVNDFLGKKVAQNVFDGMVSPVFNLGVGALKWKWAGAVKAGDLNQAAAYLRKTGVTARGKKLAGLVRRRKEEALLIEKGVYTGIGGNDRVPVDAMADGVLVRGEAGPAVAKLIKDLAALGIYKGVKDDVFGPGTESAVMTFQRDNGLDADGRAGPKTLSAIEAVLAIRKDLPKSTQPSQDAPQPVPAPEPAPEPPRASPKGSGPSGTSLVIGGAIAVIGTALLGWWEMFIELLKGVF